MKFDGLNWRKQHTIGFKEYRFYNLRTGDYIHAEYAATNKAYTPDGRGYLAYDGQVYTTAPTKLPETPGLSVVRLWDGAWEVRHNESGYAAHFQKWACKWHAEEFAHRLNGVFDWTLTKEQIDHYENARRKTEVRQQVSIIAETLRKELIREMHHGWPVWKTRNEFYERTNHGN